ncbi:MAG: alanine--tRNA ligase [bacterium]
MESKEIRSAFLRFFEEKGHTVLPGSSLVPHGDPTLLFTNAGMVQFKDIFTGKAARAFPRAATCQKCVRAGGKHNDLENVGYTARHHTFFEMLGNFSFGDYFKQQAIELAWEFLVSRLNLPREKLWVTIFREDDEAFRIWTETIGQPQERIVRLGEKDNFWAMGDTGPCGPCSEILIDQGPEFSCGQPNCAPGCDCDRYLELWNLVFMQYERSKEGVLSPLPKPSIDTGMGLERVSAVLQRSRSNYETDLFWPVIRFIGELSGREYLTGCFGAKDNVSIRVIADHARSCTFLIADGVLPSNEGRGYVLRRIIRRAARHGKMLGIERPFLFQTIERVVSTMKDAYPEIEDRQGLIASVVRQEEERFSHTLERGMAVLDEIIARARQQADSGQAEKARIVPGEDIFRLYDTFGFPVDLAQDILKENSLEFDQAGFEAAMDQQRQMARQAWVQGAESRELSPALVQLGRELPPTWFLGYTDEECQARVLAILRNGERVSRAEQGDEVDIILDKTTFYGEKGGQVGDQGILEKEGMRAEVFDTRWPTPSLVIHRSRIKKGHLQEGDEVQTRIDRERRKSIARNHTATHLLQAALRQVLGDHVKQSGSLVEPDRLRFDFTHFTAVLPEELERVESLINEKVVENLAVNTTVMNREEAVRVATALFGEKYEQEVRVVRTADFSSEVCGGTHTGSTGEIGLFKITNESSIAAGVRRIEAITGFGAYQYVRQIEQEVRSTARLLKSDLAISRKVEQLVAVSRQQEKEIQRLKEKLSASITAAILEYRRQVDDITVLAHHIRELELDAAGLRDMADLLKDRLRSGIIVLGSTQDGKVNLVAVVTNDLSNRFHAGNIIKKISAIVGGSGGGRPTMAQAGGNRPEKLDEALLQVAEIVKE